MLTQTLTSQSAGTSWKFSAHLRSIKSRSRLTSYPYLEGLHSSAPMYANLHYLNLNALPLVSDFHCMPEAIY